jgi:NAD(P)H-hydrate epimerase
MKILTIPETQELDRFTIENEPISSFNLMERAAFNCYRWIYKHVPNKKTIAVLCGPGNNGGDGIAIARSLLDKGYAINCYLIQFSSNVSEDNKKQAELFKRKHPLHIIHTEGDFPKIRGELLIDALFGTGISRPLAGNWGKLIIFLNESFSKCISIDSPSGLFLDKDNSKTDSIIQATRTLTFQSPKKAMLFPENEIYVGELYTLDIGLSKQGLKKLDSNDLYLEKNDVSKILKKRKKHSHKGDYGHALIIAGSKGMIGASILSAKACLQSGVGLLTIHCPSDTSGIIHSSIPEAMIQVDENENCISAIDINEKHQIGIGPGLGKDDLTQKALSTLIKTHNKAMVIDADALNFISEHRELISHIPAGSILTPHPKEGQRILGACENSWELYEHAREFALDHQVVFILKGAYTQIHCPDGTCYFNSTGNPGMATAGSGDVLTGILTSLLAQGYTSEEASKLGVFLHGKAGDIMADKLCEESLTASTIIAGIPLAFKHIRK